MTTPCPRCQGSGETPVPHAHPNRPATQPCPACHGSGDTETPRNVGKDFCLTCAREAARDAGLDRYIARARVALGFSRSDAIDEIIGWCLTHRPEVGVEIAPCVHSWFARPGGNWRCGHCGMTIELP